MLLKPFNLERALNGEQVVMRNGTKIIQIFHADKATEERPVIAVTEKGNINRFYEDGIYTTCSDHGSSLDLFMLGKEPKKLWAGLYKSHDYYYLGVICHNEENIERTNKYIKTICIEIEE